MVVRYWLIAATSMGSFQGSPSILGYRLAALDFSYMSMQIGSPKSRTVRNLDLASQAMTGS